MATFTFKQELDTTMWVRCTFEIEADTYEEALALAEKYKTKSALERRIDLEASWDTLVPTESNNDWNTTILLYHVPDDGTRDKFLGCNGSMLQDVLTYACKEHLDELFQDLDHCRRLSDVDIIVKDWLNKHKFAPCLNTIEHDDFEAVMNWYMARRNNSNLD